jgi:subtilisin family serine protease
VQFTNGLPGGFTTPYFVPGSVYPTLPGLPAIPALVSGPGAGPTPPASPGPGGDFGTQQIAGFITPPNNADSNFLDFTPINLGGLTGGAGGAGGAGGNGGTTGSLANGGQGGNGAPPGTRLIDMPIIPLPPGSGMPPPGETHFANDHVVFQIGNAFSPQQVADIAAQFGLTVESAQVIDTLGRTIYTLNTNGKPVREAIGDFESSGITGFMQPEYGFTLTQNNADPDAGIGDPAQYVIGKFHLPESHRIARGDNVTIAVIDSEIDVNHPDLAGVVTNQYDAGCGASALPDAHGTGMTGAIASHQHLLGVAPNAKVIAICAFGSDASGESTSIKIIKGLDYAIQQGARIVNMSFAGPRDPTLAQALQIAREKGMLLIAAAGNAGPKSPPLYPGADPNVLAVTATDDHDHLFNGANQGKYIAVAAPGVDVLVPAPHEGIQITTGTSVATAHVSGVAALLLAQKSSRTPEEIRAILVQTAKHLGPKGSETQFGAGLVDPLKALRLVPPRVSQNSTATMASTR